MDNQSLIDSYPYCEAFFWNASIQKYTTPEFAGFSKIAAIRIQNRKQWYFALQHSLHSIQAEPEAELEIKHISISPEVEAPIQTQTGNIIEYTADPEITSDPITNDNLDKDLESLEKEYLSQIAHSTLTYTLEDLPVEPQKAQEISSEELPRTSAKQYSKQSFTAWMNTIIEEDANPKNKQQSIVEKFLSQEVETTKKPNFFSATTLAKASLEEHEDFITPTLAAIYEKQGNYSKAIDAYKKLALKFPEKSSYFAALILKVEQKQKKK